jgi:SNF2 family DNA or RNA helicase
MKLHDYQLKGAQFWIDNPRTYFAIDMGLGKTATVLYALTKIKKPALVVAPLRTVYDTWPNEIKKWNFPLKYSIIHGSNKLKAIATKADVYITNYESIPFIYDTLVFLVQNKRPLPFEVCIVDEGSMIKATKTTRFKYFEALRKVFPKYRTILSGTPAPNSLQDLWAQYYFLNDGKLFSQYFGTFRRTYFDADEYNPYTYTLKPDADKQIYNIIKPYTFRLDAKDYIKLPDIIYNYIPLALPNKLKKQYAKFKKEFLLTIGDIDHEALNSATLSLKLRQFLQGFIYYNTGEYKPSGEAIRKVTEIHKIKLTALIQLIEETNQPILCAIQFKYELEMIRAVYPTVPIIAGGTKNKDAVNYINQWNKGKIPLLLCHPKSLSHGVNLQSGGCNIVWYSQTWSLEQYKQLNKRLHRQGQKKGVVIHHLIIQNTIDEKITKVLAAKDMTQQALLDYLRDETNY